MLQRRQRIRSGIERSPPREFPTHRAWVRGFDCVCIGVGGCEGSIEAAHLRLGVPAHESGAAGLKPHDKWTWPGCSHHHRLSHTLGEATFQARYGIDLLKICAHLAATSPHRWRWEEVE